MNGRESLRIGWRSIRAHRLRSALTTLGVVIGVAAVITFVVLGASLQTTIVGDISTESSRNVDVGTASADEDGPRPTNSQSVFTERDVERLSRLEGVDRATPTGPVPAAAVRFDGRTVAVQGVKATTPERFDDAEFESGRAFERGSDELVVNERAARLLNNATVGERVTIVLTGGEEANLTVVGVVADSEEGGSFGPEPTPELWLPTEPYYSTTVESPTTGEQMRAYPSVTVVADAPENVPEVQSAVERYLETESDARRLLSDGAEFRTLTAEQLVDQIREFIGTFTAFVTGVAVISLVVGAIGIANIMLVSVTERTREIGIMKAVGARNRDILQLFLVEAVALGVVGALLGTVLGLAAGYGASRYIGLEPTFPLEYVPLAAAVGVLVGVASGLYPAWSAARTDPIDALRYE